MLQKRLLETAKKMSEGRRFVSIKIVWKNSMIFGGDYDENWDCFAEFKELWRYLINNGAAQ